MTSPSKDDFLGRTNNVSFSITGAQFEVLLRVTATYQDPDPQKRVTVKVEDRYTPDANNKINDTLALNFAESAPEVFKWRLSFEVIEKDTVGNQFTYTKPNPFDVFVDVRAPRFESFNPQNSTYVRGNVTISSILQETHVDKWKVTVNGADIPENSGSSNNVNVVWQTNTVQRDGAQSIAIKVDDKAKNSSTKTITVTLDRVKPSARIVAPDPATPQPPNSNLVVQVDITDQFADSLHITGIDVVAKDMNGRFLTRVARRAANPSGNTLSWAGRIRDTKRLPRQFKLIVTVVDRAGNVGAQQEVTVRIGNR